MKTLAERLNESICNYEQLSAKITELSEQIDSISPDEIVRRCSSIRELQELIAEKDVSMHQIMEFTGAEVLDDPLIGEYQRALDVAIKEAGTIELKALMQKSLLLQEIVKGQMCLKEISAKAIVKPQYDPLLH